jgi:trehalose 6-phosphate synthase
VPSQFAGTTWDLPGAIPVNPYHFQSTAEGIYHAQMLPEEEKKQRMKKTRENVQRNDIYWWLEQFLRAQREAVRER